MLRLALDWIESGAERCSVFGVHHSHFLFGRWTRDKVAPHGPFPHTVAAQTEQVALPYVSVVELRAAAAISFHGPLDHL